VCERIAFDQLLRSSAANETIRQSIKGYWLQIKNSTVLDSDRKEEAIHRWEEHHSKEYQSCFRFPNIPCLKATAIFSAENEFFHANQIAFEGTEVIATQYPVPSQCKLFWEIFLDKGALVIDLTNEGDTKKKRGFDYKPLGHMKWEDFEVSRLAFKTLCFSNSQDDISLFDIYSFGIKREGGTTIVKDVINYRGWNDHEKTDLEDLIRLINLMRQYDQEEKPVIVHCMAGVGRSGTLIALRFAVEQILQNKIEKKKDLMEKLNTIILACRRQRGENVVQTLSQYASIVEACLKILDNPSLII
jgi:protein tyrosine phosphatase